MDCARRYTIDWRRSSTRETSNVGATRNERVKSRGHVPGRVDWRARLSPRRETNRVYHLHRSCHTATDMSILGFRWTRPLFSTSNSTIRRNGDASKMTNLKCNNKNSYSRTRARKCHCYSLWTSQTLRFQFYFPLTRRDFVPVFIRSRSTPSSWSSPLPTNELFTRVHKQNHIYLEYF